MERVPVFKDEHTKETLTRKKKKLRLRLTRISPFLLLTGFLIFWFPFVLTTRVRTETTIQIIAFPFVIAYVVFADFAYELF